MTDLEKKQRLEKILFIYSKMIYPSTQLKITEIKEVDGRIYLTHTDNESIVSLLPPIDGV
jgi:hypothetical protein